MTRGIRESHREPHETWKYVKMRDNTIDTRLQCSLIHQQLELWTENKQHIYKTRLLIYY